MSDAELQRRLNELVKLTNILEKDAVRRHGRDGFLFYESEGTFYIMDGDSAYSRQKHIKNQSSGISKLQTGAW